MRFYNVQDMRADGLYIESYQGPGLEVGAGVFGVLCRGLGCCAGPWGVVQGLGVLCTGRCCSRVAGQYLNTGLQWGCMHAWPHVLLALELKGSSRAALLQPTTLATRCSDKVLLGRLTGNYHIIKHSCMMTCSRAAAHVIWTGGARRLAPCTVSELTFPAACRFCC
jgi:hypothetical protein